MPNDFSIFLVFSRCNKDTLICRTDIYSKIFQRFAFKKLSKIFQRFAFKNFPAICFQNFESKSLEKICQLAFKFLKAILSRENQDGRHQGNHRHNALD